MKIYMVERNERDLPVAVLLDLQTKNTERMLVDWVYDLPLYVRSRFPDAVRVAPDTFAMSVSKESICCQMSTETSRLARCALIFLGSAVCVMIAMSVW